MLIFVLHIDGNDFNFGLLNITFLAGSVNNTFNVTINDDGVFERNEAFNLTLLTIPSPKSISIANGTTTVFIVDNDREY